MRWNELKVGDSIIFDVFNHETWLGDVFIVIDSGPYVLNLRTLTAATWRSSDIIPSSYIVFHVECSGSGSSDTE